MTQYLRGLVDELAKTEVDLMLEPVAELKPNEMIVGEMSDELRKLWTRLIQTKNQLENVRMQMEKSIMEAILGLKPKAAAKAEIDVLATEEIRLVDEDRTLGPLFWRSVRVEHPSIANKPAIGVCRGWKVTYAEPPQGVCPDCGQIHGAIGETEQEMPEPETESEEPEEEVSAETEPPADAAPGQPEGPNFFGLTK